MIKDLKKEDFELYKIKVSDKGKVEEINIGIVCKSEGVEFVEPWKGSTPRIIHPDLEKALEDLRPFLADSNDLKPHRKLPKMVGAIAKAAETLENTFVSLDRAVEEACTVTGISLGGDMEDGWVVITGKRKIHHTGGAMNSPKINFNGESFGFEEKIKPFIQKVIDECYELVVNHKSMTPELFNEEAA